MNKFTKGPSTHPINGPLTEERLIRVRDELAAAAKRSDGGKLGYMMADAVKAIDELLAQRAAPQLPQPAVPEGMRNKLKAEGLAELLKDAHEYAPLTAAQWETPANNWHQTFVGLSGEDDACRAAMSHKP